MRIRAERIGGEGAAEITHGPVANLPVLWFDGDPIAPSIARLMGCTIIEATNEEREVLATGGYHLPDAQESLQSASLT